MLHGSLSVLRFNGLVGFIAGIIEDLGPIAFQLLFPAFITATAEWNPASVILPLGVFAGAAFTGTRRWW